MEFREIDKDNYRDLMSLELDENQRGFVASASQSLLESLYEEGLIILGIYFGKIMIGYLLFDYDKEIPGWSLSRFMIDKKYQNKGFGKIAVREFLNYFKDNIDSDKIYISVNIDNIAAIRIFQSIGFKKVRKIEYVFMGKTYEEIQMVKKLL